MTGAATTYVAIPSATDTQNKSCFFKAKESASTFISKHGCELIGFAIGVSVLTGIAAMIYWSDTCAQRWDSAHNATVYNGTSCGNKASDWGSPVV